MKSNLFTFETSVGTFWIRPEPAGRVRLGIGRNRLKTYHSAAAAARDVATRNTGWADWDELAAENAPKDLRKWQLGAMARTARTAGRDGRGFE